ncbi:hypothetical protein ABET51_07915 [Metabacillus fastidiosus]|uniref:hypothetical protein n=1 Tax=Metabacillus fastidiosus TaxID=1458 RepID=UPI003D283D83
MDNQQKINIIRQMLDEKVKDREDLKNKLDCLQLEIKNVDASITAFQNELEKLTGDKVILDQVPLRGGEIGKAALEALKTLGGSAHYFKIKEEIEKSNIISGINDKSKADSVWNQLNKSDLVIKLGRGEFKLK